MSPIVPDFRSPNTGLYANLARLNLPYAEAVFDIGYFRENPEPFYVLAKELYPGNYSPTISHVFIALLAKKGLLRMLFTQNIDCLERQAGVPSELIVEAHGSFATQRCIECKTELPDDIMKHHVFKGEVPRCSDKKCNGLVKPDIVFFGEALPKSFYLHRDVAAQADLAFIMGTSLTVHPFAGLPDLTPEDCPRVLFNMERVGTLGREPDDVVVLGDCDSSVRKLADELGWRDELEEDWREIVGEKEAARQLRSAEERQATLQDEVEQLADEVGTGLNLDDEASNGDGAADSEGQEIPTPLSSDRSEETTRKPSQKEPDVPAATATSQETNEATEADSTTDQQSHASESGSKNEAIPDQQDTKDGSDKTPPGATGKSAL